MVRERRMEGEKKERRKGANERGRDGGRKGGTKRGRMDTSSGVTKVGVTRRGNYKWCLHFFYPKN